MKVIISTEVFKFINNWKIILYNTNVFNDFHNTDSCIKNKINKIPETQNYYINLLIETAGKHFYHTTKLCFYLKEKWRHIDDVRKKMTTFSLERNS